MLDGNGLQFEVSAAQQRTRSDKFPAPDNLSS